MSLIGELVISSLHSNLGNFKGQTDSAIETAIGSNVEDNVRFLAILYNELHLLVVEASEDHKIRRLNVPPGKKAYRCAYSNASNIHRWRFDYNNGNHTAEDDFKKYLEYDAIKNAEKIYDFLEMFDASDSTFDSLSFPTKRNMVLSDDVITFSLHERSPHADNEVTVVSSSLTHRLKDDQMIRILGGDVNRLSVRYNYTGEETTYVMVMMNKTDKNLNFKIGTRPEVMKPGFGRTFGRIELKEGLNSFTLTAPPSE